ncbi:PaaX family transcriptional regulator [Acidiphilium sp. AL]|uniref:PaaX family transcriptional regulator n=1 Tax=Acidiphilium sp. AL TaxID=2871704 RepID=UPI0021CAECF6|nr:PaaX family transcriptional regulator C-terminal domain-containing protein [Acidiphilium sp. AL]MCU4160841.1 PaaX family transcriptional regulator [Acidiphilium sp. AL]
MNAHVAAILARLQEQPSHTGSLIVTLFGDAILPRGGAVALSTIIELCAAIGIGSGVVRTAVSRLAADGWLVATRQSRASFYRIGPARSGEFIRAARHIFGPARRQGVHRLTIVLSEPGEAREAARDRLAKLGFVAWQGVMLAPERPLPPSFAAGVTALTATATPEALQRLAAKAWRLEVLGERYQSFIEAFESLARQTRRLDACDALIARTLLIHDYRRIILRDPRLPGAFLPEQWQGHAARGLCGALYADLLAPAENWLDRNARTETGDLPPPDPSLWKRFANG